MKDSKYKIELVESVEEYSEIVNRCPDASVFQSPYFLQPIQDAEVRYFKIVVGTQIKGGAALCIKATDTGEKVFMPLPVIHSGLFFTEDYVDSQHLSKRNSAQFRMLECFVSYLEQNFEEVHLRLIPEHIDMRPFLWLNYGSEGGVGMYKLNPRYTSFINLDVFKGYSLEKEEELEAFKQLGVSRRQEIRQARKEMVEVFEADSVDDFLHYYGQMASAYSDNIEAEMKELSAIMLSLQKAESLKIYLLKDKEGKVTAGTAFGRQGAKAYYLYGFTPKESRERYSGSVILWESLARLEKQGVQSVDLEGVNSPQRGWFKLSFGGELVPYYELKWKKGESL